MARRSRKQASGGGKRVKSSRKEAVGRRAPVSPRRSVRKPPGCDAVLFIGERTESTKEELAGKCEVATSIKEVARRGRTKGRGGGGAVGRLPRVSERLCRCLAAVGHQQRAAVLRKLLEGPATYRALQKVTKLKAGPLYHHINQLRMAGLILPKQRDLYELTRGGRNLILTVLALGPLVGDARRRPV